MVPAVEMVQHLGIAVETDGFISDADTGEWGGEQEDEEGAEFGHDFMPR